MVVCLDNREIERLRKVIRRSFASQPHKIKVWLALLDTYASRSTNSYAPRDLKPLDISRAAVNPPT
jgi:hypothetical protein